jgi:hypothetical protein
MSRLGRLMKRKEPPLRLVLAPELEKHSQDLFRAMDMGLKMGATARDPSGTIVTTAAIKACAMLAAMYASLNAICETEEGRERVKTAFANTFDEHVVAFVEGRKAVRAAPATLPASPTAPTTEPDCEQPA